MLRFGLEGTTGRFKLIFAALLTGLSVPYAIFAQTERVDNSIRATMEWRKIPGLSLAVVKNGKILYARGYGLANVELQAAATIDTVYQVGSLGKQFTATAVMMMVEDGQISLDDKIGKYLEGSPDIWKEITIRHLLTHTSGIKNYADRSLNTRIEYSDEDLLKKAASFPLEFAPGEKERYSNTGYLLLGFIIKKVTGKFFGDYLRKRIFMPLNMDTARIVGGEEDIVPHRAAGYRLLDGQLRNQSYVSASLNRTADGSLYLTVKDLAKWDAALYGQRLLKQASLAQMWTPVTLNNGQTYPYGFGWALGNIRGHRIVEHGGSWQGFTAHIARYLDDKLTVIVLMNLAGRGADPSSIAHEVAGIYVQELLPEDHVDRKAIKVNPTILDAYPGRYEIDPKNVIEISKEGGKLLVQLIGRGGKAELFAESETKFFLKVESTQFTFVKNDKGQVIHIIVHEPNGDSQAKRVN